MELKEFAQTVLFGRTLTEKLRALELAEPTFTDNLPGPSLSAPEFPGRPPGFERSGKAIFPDSLETPRKRGEVLHFFANHELLAMELMALVLLKFPDAPREFRLGVARTLREEQGHLSLYLKRMSELGVEFGELPLNSYFWKTMSPMASPMDFVTQMSMTFEQANLDFALHFKQLIEKTGDAETASILERVFRDEISHVRHGVHWFNRWRPPGESDWDAYRRLLPPPMTPRRAKGRIFCASARREAGLSEKYIETLDLYSGAKGRPPVLWWYNPFCEAEIARGKIGHSPKANLQELTSELEHLPIYLAHPKDSVMLRHAPDPAWLRTLVDAGIAVPECVSHDPRKIREPKFGGLQPWGWSPESFELFRPLSPRLVATSGGNSEFCRQLLAATDYPSSQIARFSSKAWGTRFFREWLGRNPELARIFDCEESVGQVFEDLASAREYSLQILASGRKAAIKLPWASAGAGVKRLLDPAEWGTSLGAWCERGLREQGALIVEPWLEKIHDVSIQFDVFENETTVHPVRKFRTGPQNDYLGTYLGAWKNAFDAKSMALLTDALPTWKHLVRDTAHALRTATPVPYLGPVGMDAMIYRSSRGELRLKPCSELNPRWTMGRVALALERVVAPGAPAAWVFASTARVGAGVFGVGRGDVEGYAKLTAPQTLRSFWNDLRQEIPTSLAADGKLREGLLATQDPARAKHVLTFLAVGEKATQLLGFGSPTVEAAREPLALDDTQ